MNRFSDRRVIVTGAGSGIGAATVARLLDEGATVVGYDISADGLAATTAAAEGAGTAPVGHKAIRTRLTAVAPRAHATCNARVAPRLRRGFSGAAEVSEPRRPRRGRR